MPSCPQPLAAGERTLEANLTPRVALYHVFHAIWCSSGAQLEGPQDDDPTAADDTTRRLLRIAGAGHSIHDERAHRAAYLRAIAERLDS